MSFVNSIYNYIYKDNTIYIYIYIYGHPPHDPHLECGMLYIYIYIYIYTPIYMDIAQCIRAQCPTGLKPLLAEAHGPGHDREFAAGRAGGEKQKTPRVRGGPLKIPAEACG